MEVRYLFAVIALLLAVWLLSTQIRSNRRNRLARKSRENLRDRAVDRTLVGRLFGGSRAAGKRKPGEQQAIAATRVVTRVDDVEDAMSGSFDVADDSGSLERIALRSQLQELHSQLQEKDQTIHQLQQVLEELTSTTATRESVNFLQKQLITSRAKVLQQEGELKQLRVEMGKRRLPLAAAAAVPDSDPSSNKHDVQTQSSQSTQSTGVMKAQLTDQLKHAEADAEDTQQNALELRRLRSELESIREDRSSARNLIEELQIRIVEQQKALERGTDQPAASGVRRAVRPLYATLEAKDDLKLIKGIGPVLERKLNELGITTLRQLAGFTEHDIERVSFAIAVFPGRIERDDWVGKAQELMAGRKDPA